MGNLPMGIPVKVNFEIFLLTPCCILKNTKSRAIPPMVHRQHIYLTEGFNCSLIYPIPNERGLASFRVKQMKGLPFYNTSYQHRVCLII